MNREAVLRIKEDNESILIVCISPSIHLYRWIIALKKTGKKVFLVNISSSQATYDFSSLCEVYIELTNFKSVGFLGKITRFFILVIRSRMLIDKHSIKLINLHYCDYVSVLFLSMLQKVPFVLSFWGTDAYNDYNNRRGLIKILYDNYYSKAMRITCNSEVVRNILAQGGKEINLINWPLEMDVLSIPTYEKKLSLRKAFNISSDSLVLLSSRALKANYSILELIDWYAASRVENSVLLIHVPPFSNSEYAQRCKEAAKDIPGVIISSKDQDIIGMSELYALADVQLNFPVNDSIPSSMLEAMACGCSVIANRDVSTYLELSLRYSLLLADLKTLTIDDINNFLHKQNSNKHIIGNRNLIDEFYSQHQFIESVKALYQKQCV